MQRKENKMEGRKGDRNGKVEKRGWEIVRKERRGGRRGRGDGNGIKRWEVEKAIGRLRSGKAAREVKLGSEDWKYGGEGLRRIVWEVCEKVWKGEGWPER